MKLSVLCKTMKLDFVGLVFFFCSAIIIKTEAAYSHPVENLIKKPTLRFKPPEERRQSPLFPKNTKKFVVANPMETNMALVKAIVVNKNVFRPKLTPVTRRPIINIPKYIVTRPTYVEPIIPNHFTEDNQGGEEISKEYHDDKSYEDLFGEGDHPNREPDMISLEENAEYPQHETDMKSLEEDYAEHPQHQAGMTSLEESAGYPHLETDVTSLQENQRKTLENQADLQPDLPLLDIEDAEHRYPETDQSSLDGEVAEYPQHETAVTFLEEDDAENMSHKIEMEEEAVTAVDIMEDTVDNNVKSSSTEDRTFIQSHTFIEPEIVLVEDEDENEFIFLKNNNRRKREIRTRLKRSDNIIEEETLGTTVSTSKYTGKPLHLTNDLKFRNIHT